MTFEDIAAWLVAFFDKQFFMLFIATGILFLLMYVTWWLYYTLSRRNIFSLHAKFGGTSYANTWDHIVYMLKYFFIFPVFTFLGFLIFALSLFLLVKPLTPEGQMNTLLSAIVIVSTIRVAAYVHEGMAEDLAKLIPLSMLAIVLSNPTLHSVGVTFTDASRFFTLIPGFLKYLVFTILLEGSLRCGTWLMRGLKDEDPDSTDS